MNRSTSCLRRGAVLLAFVSLLLVGTSSIFPRTVRGANPFVIDSSGRHLASVFENLDPDPHLARNDWRPEDRGSCKLLAANVRPIGLGHSESFLLGAMFIGADCYGAYMIDEQTQCCWNPDAYVFNAYAGGSDYCTGARDYVVRCVVGGSCSGSQTCSPSANCTL